jgi:hypothetical protein
MAKTLKDFLNERQLGPMVVKNPDEQKFIDKHVVAKTDDRNGNDDELFKGSKVKMADRPKHRKGYNPGEDEEVYEALKGNQHKIDANKNGKVDAHDFHLLRKKKKVAEEAEDLDESAEDKHFEKQSPKMQNAINLHLRKGHDYASAVKAAAKHVKEEVEELEELSDTTLDNYKEKAAKEIRDADDNDDNRHYNKRMHGYTSALKAGQRNHQRDVKKTTKEEVEQIDELSEPTVRTYYNKAGEQGKKIADKMKMGGGDWSKDGSDTKTLKKRAAGRTMALKRRSGEIKMSEDAEQIDELSKSTMGAYTKKAAADFTARKPKMGYDGQLKKMQNRKVGVNRALDKMYGEEAEQIDEISAEKKDAYAQKAGKQLPGLFAKSNSADGARKYYNRKNAVRKIANEEADQIDEILDTPEKAANYKAKAQKSFSKNVWISGDKAAHQTAKKRLYGLSHPKVAEEVEIEEKLNMDKASMGTVIKDFQKSNAPQFMGKSQKKRQVMAIAAKLSAERGGKPLNKEERLLTKLADISETHQRTMISVFEKLNEDNQREFMLACDTAEGIEQMLDFSIQHRGE